MTWRPPVIRACLIVKRTERAVGRSLRLSCRHPLATRRAESMVWCRARRSADAGGRWVSLMSARAHRRARGFTNVNEGGKPPDAGLIPRRPSIVKAAGCICGIWPVETQATGMSVYPHSLGRANGYRLYQPSARSAISLICFAISSGERMKSMQPLSIALCGISG